MKPEQIAALITDKQQLNTDTFSLELKVSGLKLLPGNFFQIRTSETYDPYLNRPISVAEYRSSRLLFIIREVGQGTRLLHQKKIGDRIPILGPMGRGIVPVKKSSLLIAGGIGIAPLIFLAQHLSGRNIPFSLIYGVKNKNEHILKRALKKLCPDQILVHEGGPGKKMTALEALKSIDRSKFDVLYACGPRAMYIEMQKMNIEQPVYVFCEDFLGCGCGICLGCAIKVNGAYKRICTDGPVFELKGIEFNG